MPELTPGLGGGQAGSKLWTGTSVDLVRAGLVRVCHVRSATVSSAMARRAPRSREARSRQVDRQDRAQDILPAWETAGRVRRTGECRGSLFRAGCDRQRSPGLEAGRAAPQDPKCLGGRRMSVGASSGGAQHLLDATSERLLSMESYPDGLGRHLAAVSCTLSDPRCSTSRVGRQGARSAFAVSWAAAVDLRVVVESSRRAPSRWSACQW
jgi:hypothetical protein